MHTTWKTAENRWVVVTADDAQRTICKFTQAQDAMHLVSFLNGGEELRLTATGMREMEKWL